MATGVFEAQEDDDDYYYFANNSGEIQQKSDWIHHEGEWYYSKDGKLYADGVKTIGGKNTISCIMQRCFQGILQKHIMTAVKLII